MTEVTLNWYQRISLWLRIGGVQAPNMKVASTLYRIIEKVRPNDEEQDKANLRMKGNGYEWMLPSVDFGTRDIVLDREEAEQLAVVLENPPEGVGILVADMAWLMPLIDHLKAKQEQLVA